MCNVKSVGLSFFPIVVTCWPVGKAVLAGSLDDTGPPEEAASATYTLEDIYYFHDYWRKAIKGKYGTRNARNYQPGKLHDRQ